MTETLGRGYVYMTTLVPAYPALLSEVRGIISKGSTRGRGRKLLTKDGGRKAKGSPHNGRDFIRHLSKG